MKENSFILKKAKSRQYPAQTITDADYADDIALLANSPTKAELQLHSLEQAAGGISLHVTADKMEYMCLIKKNISSLNGDSLKQVDRFTHFGSSVSSTENGINERLEKAWFAIDRLPIIWKSNLSDKIKRIFPSSGRVDSTA